MVLPRIRIPEIAAGLARLNPGQVYQVPNQPYSAVYLAELVPFSIELDDCIHCLRPGDLAALPRGTAHRLWTGQRGATPPATLQPPFLENPPAPSDGDYLFCCRVPTSANPLPDIVPNLLLLDPAAQRSSGRLEETFALLRYHALNRRENRSLFLRNLAEICATLFLECILDDYRARGVDVANAVGDPKIRRALNAIHAEPSRRWTLESLAEASALSRSSFAERFKRTTGQSPLAYLSQYRLAAAARMLREEDLPVGAVAHAVGYDTDSAFSKAFRKEIGLSPRAYRQRERQS